MARKKVKARTTKQQPQKNTVTGIIKQEKNWLATPAKLAAQLNKEISKLKQKESKVKKALDKITGQINKAEKRLQTTDGKTQRVARQALKQIISTKSALEKQAKEISKSLSTVTDTQQRLLAVRKHLSQFQKEWVKNKKQTKNNTTQPKARKAGAKKKQKTTSKEEQPSLTETPSTEFNFEQFEEQETVGS